MSARVLVIDNYDSFTYNLVDYIATAGAEVRVERNDAVTADDAEAWSPSHVVVSPGPGTPREAGVSEEVVRRMAGRIPVLGVCLGHQVICELYGGRVDRAARIVHGKPDEVTHDGSALYDGLPSPFEAGRYHSLAALAPIPESVLTPHGRRLIENFLAMEAGR
jgi:anthranilate synthase/aminodeoxychorismate synthase-like glutamine amidotransferase